MNKLWGHFSTITTHKIKVGQLCFRCGLYKQGLLHDLSKYSWVEFSAGVKYFQGNRSPIEKEKETIGYSMGWLHHKGRNKHHWEYWIDMGKEGMQGTEMPVNYVVEMFCDRVTATKIYQKDKYTDKAPYEYYLRGRHRYLMHPKTHELLESMLKMLAETDLDTTIHHIRVNILKNKNGEQYEARSRSNHI